MSDEGARPEPGELKGRGKARRVAEPEQGWVRQDELARMLRMDDNHLNISIHRARTQLGQVGDVAQVGQRRQVGHQVGQLVHTGHLVHTGQLVEREVVDVGEIVERGWAVVEANAAWASGLCGANPGHVLSVLRRASVPRNAIRPNDERWLRTAQTVRS